MERLVIWGTKYAAQVIKALCGHVEIVAIVDGNAKSRDLDKCIEGISVICPEIFFDKYAEAIKVVIAARGGEEIFNLLRKKGITSCFIISRRALEKNLKLWENNIFTKNIKYLDLQHPCLAQIETHVCDMCNLNCRSCNHFAPLAEKNSYASKEKYEKALKLLARKLDGGGQLLRILLLGGEPLIDTNLLCDFILISKKIFPDTDVHIYTNGLLLPKVDQYFWDICERYDITINITMYPPTVDIKEDLVEILEQHSCVYSMSDPVDSFIKRISSDVKKAGSTDVYNPSCGAWSCHFLRDERLYKCPDGAMVELFDKKYGTNLKTQNYIDLSKDDISGWDMIDKLQEPIDMCQICGIETETVPWERAIGKTSKKEWIICRDDT